MNMTDRLDLAAMIIEWASKNKKRVTYGCVADALKLTKPLGVAIYFGDQCKEASWIVSEKTGMPTGYPVELYAEGLIGQTLPPITSVAVLQRFMPELL